LWVKSAILTEGRINPPYALIYCRDHRCSHHVETNADGWPDDVRLSDIEANFTCTRCGKRGADVRPKFSQASMGFRQVPCRTVR